jgi:hypothetical protein
MDTVNAWAPGLASASERWVNAGDVRSDVLRQDCDGAGDHHHLDGQLGSELEDYLADDLEVCMRWPTVARIVLSSGFQHSGVLAGPCWAAARALARWQVL